MNESTRMLVDTAERIFGDLCTKEIVDAAERGQWPNALWEALAEAGFLQAAVPETQGGTGLPLAEAYALLRVAGRYAAPLPLAETLLGAALLARAGVRGPTWPLALAVVDISDRVEMAPVGETLRIDGCVEHVPWASRAPWIVVAQGGIVACVSGDACAIDAGRNMAGEPRDRVRFDRLALARDAWGETPAADSAFELAALGRAVLMAGALESALAMGVDYALERQQFGRPLAKFQAVQQQLAVLAGETAAAIRASDGALEALDTPREATEIAVAKARVGEAAGRGAAIAHQVHGAMGFTHEHPLHQRTRRLWSWRDEYGVEGRWQAALGKRIAAGGADQLWTFLTETAR